MLEGPGKPKQFEEAEPRSRSMLEVPNTLRSIYERCRFLTEYASGPLTIKDRKDRVLYRIEPETDASGRPTVLISLVEADRGLFEINEAGGIRRYDPAQQHVFTIQKPPLTLGEVTEMLRELNELDLETIRPKPDAPKGRAGIYPDEPTKQ
jgi:hypothetical protein